MEKQYRNVVEECEKSFNDDERSIVHVISVEVSDRYGDIVRSDGMDKSAYEKNPVVLYGHSHKGFPVGRSLWQKATTLSNGKRGIIAKTQFADTEEGKVTYKLWRDGYLNAASIGFIPKSYDAMIDNGEFKGYDIKGWELLEYSIVPVPANQEALRLALDEFGDNLVVKSLRDEMRKTVEDEQRKKELEEIKAKNTELELLVKGLIERIDALEAKEVTTPVAETIVHQTPTIEEIKAMMDRVVSNTLQKKP